jgi:hypothetical protein
MLGNGRNLLAGRQRKVDKLEKYRDGGSDSGSDRQRERPSRRTLFYQ